MINPFTQSGLEKELLFQIKAVKLPTPIIEYKFCDTRKWRADFGWPNHLLLVEVEGGIFTNGRHSRARGFINDCEKYNWATLHGFRVLRVTAPHIHSGCALAWIEQGLQLPVQDGNVETQNGE